MPNGITIYHIPDPLPFDLAAWRRRYNMTIVALAKHFGTTPMRIGRLEKKGKFQPEFIYALAGLANALKQAPQHTHT